MILSSAPTYSSSSRTRFRRAARLNCESRAADALAMRAVWKASADESIAARYFRRPLGRRWRRRCWPHLGCRRRACRGSMRRVSDSAS
eukprot:scaffold14682_cov124-Isochrysis_galbana.AAC.12